MYQLTSPSGKNWYKNFLLFSRVFQDKQLTKWDYLFKNPNNHRYQNDSQYQEKHSF